MTIEKKEINKRTSTWSTDCTRPETITSNTTSTSTPAVSAISMSISSEDANGDRVVLYDSLEKKDNEVEKGVSEILDNVKAKLNNYLSDELKNEPDKSNVQFPDNKFEGLNEEHRIVLTELVDRMTFDDIYEYVLKIRAIRNLLDDLRDIEKDEDYNQTVDDIYNILDRKGEDLTGKTND